MKSLTTHLDAGIQSCTSCPLHNVICNFENGKMLGFGVGRDVLVVGQNPSQVRYGFGGYGMDWTDAPENTSAWFLGKILKDVSWPMERTYFTNLVKCSTEDNAEPNEESLDKCVRNWFSQEYLITTPKLVVCLGNFVYDYLTFMDGDKKKFDFMKNATIKKVYHHAYIARFPDKYDEWRLQWEMIGVS